MRRKKRKGPRQAAMTARPKRAPAQHDPLPFLPPPRIGPRPLVKDYMTRGVAFVEPHDTTLHVLRKLVQLDVRALPVCEGTRLVAMIGEDDLGTTAAPSTDAEPLLVRQLMRPIIAWSYEDADWASLIAKMRLEDWSRVPVVNHHGELVGIVARGDWERAPRPAAVVRHAAPRPKPRLLPNGLEPRSRAS